MSVIGDALVLVNTNAQDKIDPTLELKKLTLLDLEKIPPHFGRLAREYLSRADQQRRRRLQSRRFF